MNPHLNIKQKLDTKATLACCIAVLFWASGPIGIRLLTKYLDSYSQNAIRYLTAALFWMPFLAISIRKKNLAKNIWKNAMYPASFNILGQTLWAATLYYLDPALATLIQQSSVIVVAAFSIIIFADERILIKSPAFITGFILAIIGITGVLAFKQGFADTRSITGIILALFSSLVWAGYVLSIKIKMKNCDPRHAFAVISAYTALGLTILALFLSKLQAVLQMPPVGWIIAVVSAILAMALSHTLYYTAIIRIGAAIPAIAMLAMPFVVLALSNFLFNEKLNTPQCIFGLALISGAATAILAQNKIKSQ